MTQPVAVAQDRSMLIEAGTIVRTGYLSVFKCRLACRARMAIGDIDRAYQGQIQIGAAQSVVLMLVRLTIQIDKS